MNKCALRSSHPSLFPLQTALFAAQALTPARPSRLLLDPDETLALALLMKIKDQKREPFVGLRIESPQPPCRETFAMEETEAYA
ncbi:MAG: hypothetical protein OZ914_01395 [Anaerolineaceae bacterium]|nr:hypothetical protein [Anaerolineaceae bacterium]